MDNERQRDEARRVYEDTGAKDYAPGEWSRAISSLNKKLADQSSPEVGVNEPAEHALEAEATNGRLIPYEDFIANVDGYLTGYLYAKQELEKLESERKPSIIMKKDYQKGFPHVRWEELKTQTFKMSTAFRGFRLRTISEQPELKDLFDQFDEANKRV